jgi:hypothetical protein
MIREGFTAYGPPEHESEHFRLAPAPIEAVDELLQVALEVFSADAVEGPPEPVLQIPENDVTPGQDFTGASGVALDVAIVAHADSLEAPVRGVSVGAKRGFRIIDDTEDKRSQVALELDPFQDGHPQPTCGVTSFLHSYDDNRLRARLTASASSRLVTSDIGFIGFDDSSQARQASGFQARAQLVEHRPSRLVAANPQVLLEL